MNNQYIYETSNIKYVDISYKFICENLSNCIYSSPTTRSINEKLKTIDISDIKRRDEYGNKIAYYIALGGNFEALNIVLYREGVDPLEDIFYNINSKGEDFINFNENINSVVTSGHSFYYSYYVYWLNFFKVNNWFSQTEIQRILEKAEPSIVEIYLSSYV